MEFLSSMTRFEPVTPELVSRLSEVRLSYEEVSRYLAELGLSIQHVVHDPSRQILHTYYADFDRGLYCPISFTRDFLKAPDGVTCSGFRICGKTATIRC